MTDKKPPWNPKEDGMTKMYELRPGQEKIAEPMPMSEPTADEKRAAAPPVSRFSPASSLDDLTDSQVLEGVVDRIWSMMKKLDKPPKPITLTKLAYLVQTPDEFLKADTDPISAARHTYRTRDGLVPWNRVIAADGTLRILRENPEARLHRVIISLPRNGEWYRIKATHGLARRKQRGRRRESLYSWLRRLGYTHDHVELTWTIRGLSVRWLKADKDEGVSSGPPRAD